MKTLKDVTLYQDNILTQSRNELSAIEKNCIYLIIEEIQKRNLRLDTLDGNNLVIHFENHQLNKAVDNRNIKDVYNGLKKLSNRKIEIDNTKEWLYVGFVNYAKHVKEKNVYELEVSNQILPYLVELTVSNQFTSYQLTVALSLRSQYAKRFYELCNQYKNQKLTNGTRWFFLTIEHIRDIFMLKHKYNDSYAFKKFVIDIAQKELQAAFEKGESDLYFTYDIKDKQGKKELSYNFYIHTREDEERKAFNYATLPQIMGRIDSILTAYVKRNPKYIKRVKEAVQLNPDIAQPMLEKLFKITEKYERKEIVPVIYYVLNEDFDIQAKTVDTNNKRPSPDLK